MSGEMVKKFTLFMTLMLVMNASWAECSADYEGLAVINEVSDTENFIEIKVLTSAIGSDIYDDWTLSFCSKASGKKNDPVTCSSETSLSLADGNDYPWLVLDSQDFGGKVIDLRALEIRLSDSSGDTIDYLRVADLSDSAAVDEVSTLDDPDCNILQEVDSGGGNSGKLSKRQPDGAGDWSLPPGGSGGEGTDGSSNDGGGGAVSSASIDNVTVQRGDTAELTVELVSTVTVDVSVIYETRDGTAEAGSDYDAMSDAVTIPAGALSVAIPIPTIANGDQTTEQFRVLLTSLSSSANVALSSQLGIVTLLPAQESPDHFEIVHDGVALTCQPETVTIRACANADCTDLFTDPVEATLSPTDGWVGGNVVSISGGTGQASLQNTTAGDVELDVIGSQPSARPQSVTLCEEAGSDPSAASCLLKFLDSGLAFDIPDMISHREEQNIQVRAVERDAETDQCGPAFENVDRTVGFWSTYIDPDATGRPASRPVSVDGTEVSGSESSPTPLTLNFGAGGVAEIDVRYPDAGQMQLDALYQGSVANEDEGLLMPGADIFASRPAGLCVATAGECAAADASCPTFVKAGESFDLSVTAVGWQSDSDADFCAGNPITPNFAMPDIALASQLVEPSAGVPGTLDPLSYDHLPSADATTVVPSTMSEVGVFRFSATPLAGGYFGQTIPLGTSLPAGRFYPDRFIVSVDPGEFESACVGPTSFTYTGQDFGWLIAPSLLIEPVSASGSRTRNYADPAFTDPADRAFQKLSLADITSTVPAADRAAVNEDGDPLAVTVSSGPGTLNAVDPGLLEFEYSAGDTARYNKVVEARVAPVVNPILDFVIDSIEDSDNVAGAGAPYTVTPVMDFELRYGRLEMDNVYGPENLAANGVNNSLFMPFRVEYWNGSRFVLNQADNNCTTWNTANITDTENFHSLQAASGTFSTGEGGPLALDPNGTPGEDTLTWAVPFWLWDDQDGEGTLEQPSALATFGVYRGNDRVIYWQER